MRYAFGEVPAILHQNLRGKGKLGEKAGAGQKKLPPAQSMRYAFGEGVAARQRKCALHKKF